MNRHLPFRFVITSLHLSSILTCPSSVSWLYIIFHMKTNIYKNLVLKNLAHKKKTNTATSSPNCQVLSTLFCPHPLHQLQICSTHTKFAPPTPNLLHRHQICSTTPNLSARSFSDNWLMFLHYIYTKQKHIKVFFFAKIK